MREEWEGLREHDVVFLVCCEDPRPEAAAALIQRLANLPTAAIGYMKKNLGMATHGSLSDVMDAEAVGMVRTMMTDDHKASSLAFVEKRQPIFKGR